MTGQETIDMNCNKRISSWAFSQGVGQRWNKCHKRLGNLSLAIFITRPGKALEALKLVLLSAVDWIRDLVFQPKFF